jgi:ketosteroid isomerase-like protein
MKRLFLSVVLLLLSLSASSQESSGQDILKIEEQWTQALLKADADYLERLYTDDIVYTHTNGMVNTKTEFLASLKAGKAKYLSLERSELKVRNYGDTAIVTFRALIKVNAVTLPSQIIHVFVRQNGEWRMAAYQSTRLPD